MLTSLQGIANKARRKKQHRFQNLIGMLNEEFLWECWPLLKKNVATGVDHMTAQEYGEHFIPNVRSIIEKLKKGAYRAKLVLRKWIPKGGGKLRPLGIPVLEDKLLQIAVASILRAIYEEDFCHAVMAIVPSKVQKTLRKICGVCCNAGDTAMWLKLTLRVSSTTSIISG